MLLRKLVEGKYLLKIYCKILIYFLLKNIIVYLYIYINLHICICIYKNIMYEVKNLHEN